MNQQDTQRREQALPVTSMTSSVLKPVLVIGATGTTGSLLVEALVKRNVKVRVAVRSAERAKEILGSDVELHGGFDYYQPQTLEPALAGSEQVYLVSTIDIPPTPLKAVIDLAKTAGVQHIVRLSVFGSDETSKGFGATADGARKLEVEHYIRDSGIRSTIIRPTWFSQNIAWQYGNDIRSRSVLRTPFGPDAKVNFVDTRDIAEVAAVALTTPRFDNTIYDLSGPASYTMLELADILSTELGRSIRFEDMTLEQSKTWMTSWGLPKAAVEELAAVFEQGRLGNTAGVTDDVARVTGRSAINLKRYVQDNRQAFYTN